MIAHSNPILDSVIEISENLKSSKLSENVLKEIEEPLKLLSEFLSVEVTEALFFAIIFSIQNQENRCVNLHQIAEYFDYPFLNLLKYRYAIDTLLSKGLLDLKEKTNISHHPENNGYSICGSIANCIIDGKKIYFPEEEKLCLETVLFQIKEIMDGFRSNIMQSSEYKRQIGNLENIVQDIDLIKNVTKAYPNDFESRIVLYYVSIKTIDEESFSDDERDFGFNNIFQYLLGSEKVRKKKAFRDGSDPLLKNKYIEEYWLECGTHNCLLYRFTNKGIKKFFGKDSKDYLLRNRNLSILDDVLTSLKKLSYIYESNDLRKKERLKKWEKEVENYQYFKTIKSLIPDECTRWFYLDCVNDSTKGYASSLTKTLQDIYGHGKEFFQNARDFNDEKHHLLETGLLEIEKNEDIERTRLTLSDKSLELLYGENADLYKTKNQMKNVLQPEEIKEKHLFYEADIQNQIEMLSNSLSHEHLSNIQKRLEEKGLPKGVAVILYGAPGTGKTETVYQLAKKTNRKIMHVDISESKSMWFGESEKSIKKIFSNYRSLCKSCKNHNENIPILLFNEADAIISKRGTLDGGGPRQTENAMQNILLEEMEKLAGILIATTNLCENMDAAFERRFLFKIKYEKPSIESRSKIWMNKLESISNDDAVNLAKQFDFSGGEIDNIVRKCEMNEIISGARPDYEQLVDICRQERLEKEGERRMGFFC